MFANMAKLFYLLVLFVASVSSNSITEKKFRLHSGDEMPLVGFGTYLVNGSDYVRDVIDKGLAAGYRLIDTAQAYRNEEDIGKALKELLPKYNLTRKDIWITSKLAATNQGEKAYENLRDTVNKLGTGYVDLYLVHSPGAYLGDFGSSAAENSSVLRDQSWQGLVKGVKEGLAKNIGVSNYMVKHLKELLANNHGISPAVNQVEWHPYHHPKDLLDLVRKEGILLQAYFSLGGTKTGGRERLMKNPTVQKIAEKLGKTPAQILLRWALQQNIAIIPKASSQKHMEENRNLDFEIPQEDMEALSNLSHENFVPEIWNPDNIN